MIVPKQQQRRDVLVEPPVELNVVTKHPHTVVTGLSAIIDSLKAGLPNEGLVRMLRTWFKIHQRGGFAPELRVWRSRRASPHRGVL